MKFRGVKTTSPRNHQPSYSKQLNAALATFALVIALAMVAPGPAFAQTYSVIYDFAGGPLGATPMAGLVMDRAGNLYGTTYSGGGGTCPTTYYYPGCGTVFKFNPSTGRFTVLYEFTGGTDGSLPFAPLLIAPDGTLYGSATSGGADSCAGYQGISGCGVVFHLQPRPTPPRNVLENYWLETPIYTFQGSPDGNAPYGDLAMDASGDIYGATAGGGSENQGFVFELTPSDGSWSESTLHNFLQGTSDGNSPFGGVTLYRGNIYGTAFGGGTGGAGVVFQLLAGSGWMENLLYQFTGGSDGANPTSGVTFNAGNLYCTTQNAGSGGPPPAGNAFELSGGNWTYHLLYSFAGDDGPILSDLIFDPSGNIYGTTFEGGAHGEGAVFKLTPTMGGYIYTSLHDFCSESNCADGAEPQGTLVMDSSGNLYGTTTAGGTGFGVIFKITP